MKRIAITGGIGSGKSYVCRILENKGIHVYDCDAAAKRLMASSASLRVALQKLVGEHVYRGNILQKNVLAQFLLKSEQNKQAVNEIIHPAVARDFEESEYEWLESAILFDAHFDKRIHFDFIVCVSAPMEIRIRRVMARDGISRSKTLEWIHRQLPQEEVAEKCDYEIINDGQRSLEEQIDNMLDTLYNK